MPTSRIYVVGERDDKNPDSIRNERLVRAGSKAQALSHHYDAKLAKQDDLERLLGDGRKVETARSE